MSDTTTAGAADIGVVGLGVMGASLARNFRSRGHRVAVFARTRDQVEAFTAKYGADGYVGCWTHADLVAAFDGPARIVLMVPAGPPVDSVLDALAPHLGADDVVVDAGNSHYADTDRRAKRAANDGFRFVGMGVSGGERGALEGPSMMPGGDEKAWKTLEPILVSAAAVSDSGPCVTYCGRGSAGHFVKMVHNGIEYGDMQLIAEVTTLLRHGMAQSATEVRDVFTRWNEGSLRSYLIEITSQIVAARDPEGDGSLVEQILDVAGQKGTGRWTSIGAIELGVPLPTVTAAVDARALSAMKAERVEVARTLPRGSGDVEGLDADTLENALYAAKLMSYTQGFAMLRAASTARDYGSDLAAIARIWKAGCIIRAAFLDRVYEAFRQRPELPLLILDPDFAGDLKARIGPLRRTVARSVEAGVPVPALSASLAYYDTLTRARGSASLIQAQRDFFGAHTYRRHNDPETVVHTEWEDLPQL